MTLKLARGKWQVIWRKVNEAVVNNLKEKFPPSIAIFHASRLEFIKDYYTVQDDWFFFSKRIEEKKYYDICQKLRNQNRKKLEQALLEKGEWRPHTAHTFPQPYRNAMRTLLLLAKAAHVDINPKDRSGCVIS